MATRRRYLEIPHHARRDFIKWTVGMGAALGLRPWKVFEVQESLFGPAHADGASTLQALRSLHIVAGNGGLAWFTQLFPFYGICADTTNSAVGYYMPGKYTEVTPNTAQGDQPLRLGPDAPSALATYKKKMTVFTCGANETHTNDPVSTAKISMSNAIFASCAAVQSAQPTLVPAIAVGTMPYGAAPGQPSIASVPNAMSVAGLFASVASSAGGALAKPTNAALFEAYFKANIALQKAAGRPTQTQELITAKAAANLLGKQLQLAPTTADLQRYGVDSATLASVGATSNAGKLVNIATVLIQAVKAFEQNLTSMIMLPAMNDDPHGAFGDLPTTTGTVKSLGTMLNAFLTDMNTTKDPLDSAHTLGDNLLFTITGDTFKDPNNSSGWPDGTPASSNLLIAYDGSGRLAGGAFGTVNTDGTSNSFNASTAAAITNAKAADHLAAAAPSCAAILNSVALGDSRRVGDFYSGTSYNGLLNPQLIGL